MREICTYGLMRGRAYPTRGVSLYSTILPRLGGEMGKGGDGFDVEAVLRWLIRRFVGYASGCRSAGFGGYPKVEFCVVLPFCRPCIF